MRTSTPAQPTRRRADRVRVIWNPDAGSKAGIPTNSTSEEELRALLGEYGLEGDLVRTTDERDGRAAARAAVQDGVEIVAAAGGDGTVGSVAAAVVGSSSALGVLPLGSAMNVARALGVPRDLPGAMRVLATGRCRRIDVGEANGSLFLESGSVGLHAALFREAQRVDRGDFRSIVTTLGVALRYRPARMRIELDDKIVTTRALMVSVANSPYTGLGLTVAPDARLDDGRFDVEVFSGFSRFELLRHLISIIGGRHRYSPKVQSYRSTRVHIESVRPLPARADALDLGTTPVGFVTRPGALAVIVPD